MQAPTIYEFCKQQNANEVTIKKTPEGVSELAALYTDRAKIIHDGPIDEMPVQLAQSTFAAVQQRADRLILIIR